MKLLILPLALLAGSAHAHDYAAGDLRIDHPYIVAPPPGAPVAGGYMRLSNGGASDDRLTAIEVDPSIAGAAQIHEMSMSGDVMRMDELPGGLVLPAGGAVTLEPGGLHVMFVRLAQGIAEGEEVPATLLFERAGRVEVVFQVAARGAVPAHDGHGGPAGGDGTSGPGAAHGTDGRAGHGYGTDSRAGAPAPDR